MLSKDDLLNGGEYPAYSSDSTNNGIIGYTNNPEFICDEQTPVYITFGDHTRTMNIARTSFSVLDNVKVLIPYIDNNNVLLFLISSWQKQIPNLGYARHWKIAKECVLELPTKNEKPDVEFMESFIAELEAERLAELEAYLSVTGLKDYELTSEEEQSLKDFKNWTWDSFNLETLFGKSTRGKRLKSADRINGNLPFVTAGEALEGISAYIGNDVEIFSPNTTTIDMFGSAKYRNYKYGADDHVAVVHTELLSKFAAIFTTTAIHKSAHSGRFSYSRNFYAKDADELYISLPTCNGIPDYKSMEIFISAIQKSVIKDVVLYANQKVEATKKIVER